MHPQDAVVAVMVFSFAPCLVSNVTNIFKPTHAAELEKHRQTFDLTWALYYVLLVYSFFRFPVGQFMAFYTALPIEKQVNFAPMLFIASLSYCVELIVITWVITLSCVAFVFLPSLCCLAFQRKSLRLLSLHSLCNSFLGCYTEKGRCPEKMVI